MNEGGEREKGKYAKIRFEQKVGLLKLLFCYSEINYI